MRLRTLMHRFPVKLRPRLCEVNGNQHLEGFEMIKLYRSTNDQTYWFAFGPKIGWVMFPPEVDGWQTRQPARITDLNDLCQVPLSMAFNTGIPGASMRRIRLRICAGRRRHALDYSEPQSSKARG